MYKMYHTATTTMVRLSNFIYSMESERIIMGHFRLKRKWVKKKNNGKERMRIECRAKGNSLSLLVHACASLSLFIIEFKNFVTFKFKHSDLSAVHSSSSSTFVIILSLSHIIYTLIGLSRISTRGYTLYSSLLLEATHTRLYVILLLSIPQNSSRSHFSPSALSTH